MIATGFTRNDCLLGQKGITYATLLRDYRCNGCGGRIVLKPPANGEDWHVECGVCGSRDFIHECELQRQEYEALEVLAGLPAELAAIA